MAQSLKNYSNAFDLLLTIRSEQCSSSWKGESTVVFDDMCPSMLAPYISIQTFKTRIAQLNAALPLFCLYSGVNLFMYSVFLPVIAGFFFVWAADDMTDRGNQRTENQRGFDAVVGGVFVVLSAMWFAQTRSSNKRYSTALTTLLSEFNTLDSTSGISWTTRARLHRWDYRLLGIKTPPIEVVTVVITRAFTDPVVSTSPAPPYPPVGLSLPGPAVYGGASQSKFDSVPMEPILGTAQFSLGNTTPETVEPGVAGKEDREGSGYADVTMTGASAFAGNVNLIRNGNVRGFGERDAFQRMA